MFAIRDFFCNLFQSVQLWEAPREMPQILRVLESNTPPLDFATPAVLGCASRLIMKKPNEHSGKANAHTMLAASNLSHEILRVTAVVFDLFQKKKQQQQQQQQLNAFSKPEHYCSPFYCTVVFSSHILFYQGL